MKNLIFKNFIEEIDSAEAYYKNPILKGNCLIIPYVNLGVLNHPLNNFRNEILFFDYCYMVFENIEYLKSYKYDQPIIKNDANVYRAEIQYFGGNGIDNDLFVDFQIKAYNIFLQLLPFTQSSKNNWVPPSSKGRLIKSNLDGGFTERFFNNEFMPDNIKMLLEDKQ